jgi:hypothetical protein
MHAISIPAVTRAAAGSTHVICHDHDVKICVRCGSEALLEPGPTELDVAKEAEHDKQNAQAARVHGDVSDAERGPVSHVCGRM